MSNKLFALLILIWTLWWLFGLYFYFFVGYTSDLTIESNTDEYQVELYSKRVGNSFEFDCPESLCVLSDISPLDYNLRVRKDGYETVYQDIDMPARTSLSVDVNLIKQISLSESVLPEQEISNKDRISFLRDKNKARKFFDIAPWVYAYFSEKWELYIYRDESTQKIWDFNISWDNELDVKIVPETDYVYFQIGEAKYFYDIDSWTIQTLDLWVEVNYIKQWNTNTDFLFVTPVGVYIYDVSVNSFDYFYLFKDFVYTGDNYVGIIYADEENKRNNFNLGTESENLIIRYNPATKDRDILYETSLDIDRIYLENESIYFESAGKRYELENL